jgi:methylated-DNA-[protein]-cysteine S-methyltransferase
MSNIIKKAYSSPEGALILGVFNNKLCMCDWNYRKQRNAINGRKETFCAYEMLSGNHKLMEDTMKQLNLYFKRELTAFNLPLHLCGT